MNVNKESRSKIYLFSDGVKLYNHSYLNPNLSPAALQRKVQFDIRLHFFRRGCENMEKMKRDHFKLDFNAQTEEWRVIKNRDELTKNHQGSENMVAGIMPENRTDPLCPVSSFRIYQEHMDPECEMMWPMPLANVEMSTDTVWYNKKKHWGKNTLGKFMSDVSKKCQLSQIYTNHCIRVTRATVLTRKKFSASEIMSVTGHKSVQSLATYQKTEDKQKVVMGKALFDSMTNKDAQQQKSLPPPTQYLALPPPPQHQVLMPLQNQVAQPPVPPPPQRQALMPLQNQVAQPPVQNKPNATDAIVPFNANLNDQEVPQFDLFSLINDVIQDENKEGNSAVAPKENNTQIQTATTNSVVNNVPRYMFGNCSIGHVTFNIQK